MVRSLRLSLLLGVGLLLGSVLSQAETVRVPKTGDPAFSVNVPAGWNDAYDQYGNLQFYSSDHSVMVQLSMLAQAGIGSTPLTTVAADIFKSAGAQPYTRNAPSTLAGHTGQAFYGTLNEGNVVLNMEVVLVALDDSHIACMSTLARNDATAQQLAALKALTDLVQLSGAK